MTVNETILLSDDIDNLLYVFANETILLQQLRMIRRIDALDSRYYYTLDGDEATFYISTTSFIKKVTPTSAYLIEWFKKNGQQADVLRDQAADFGTLMHICFAEYHEHGYNFNTTAKRVKEWIQQCGHPLALAGEWTKKLNKAVASYAKFCADYDIEPILIEGMLASDEMGIAGTLDLVAFATIERKIGKGKAADIVRERKLINLDFKSGNIHKSAQMQLSINKMIFEENFPHLEIAENWSWSPKDFQKEPTYMLVNQTQTIYTPALIDNYLAIYAAEYNGELEAKTFHQFTGTIKPGAELAQHHRAVGITEAILPY
ncbi:hypothetical protein [Spirosoma oryzicola]|uniref:hypothetical protein n=1 Tax=Spirosoma oryzicola TaxID=2898794 RepID=UPI001E38863C|nr:hypothetical protein [Spirosoma oryzicola]UHG91796.1 hypothetical protein LQ777_02595 [Spirosoma oryzicola]